MIYNMPKGTIMSIHKDIAEISIPEGWELCNGVAGKPNLNGNNRLLRGTIGNTGGVGGTNTHAHSPGTAVFSGGTDPGANLINSTEALPYCMNIVWIIKVDD